MGSPAITIATSQRGRTRGRRATGSNQMSRVFNASGDTAAAATRQGCSKTSAAFEPRWP
jgi:hypothetical protein